MIRRFALPVLALVSGRMVWPASVAPDEFATHVRPVLERNCAACHNATNAKGPINFLKARTAKDVEDQRGMWRNVAAQLRNRTMPPVETKLTEQERLMVATWVDRHLQETACSGQEYAGEVMVRRLNRRDYGNTIRDLLGVDLEVNGIFPADGSGGEGFDNNGESLYLPPLLTEKYLDTAQQILDRVVITPSLNKSFSGADLLRAAKSDKAPVRGSRAEMDANQELSAPLSTYAEGSYSIRLTVERSMKSAIPLVIKVDNDSSKVLTVPRYTAQGASGVQRQATMTRGVHTITVVTKDVPVGIISLSITQTPPDVTPEKRALHYRLFGARPGDARLEPRKAAQELLTGFLRKAYRRPVEPAEVEPFMKLYDRSAERGDPFEERVKLALSGVLVSPKFLFRVEKAVAGPGIHHLTDYEIATRLSYFLWSTMPDDELMQLADEGKLQDARVLAGQVNRMLADPRSRVFSDTFIGQWLGTKELGGSVAPALIDLQDFYTPEVAADLRQEPVLLFQYMMQENRSLLDLLDGNYTFLNDRLVTFYQLQDKVKGVGSEFQRVEWPDNRRGGVFGMGSVLAMTSHYKQTSPVLRGAWVLDTILGTTVPPPPPDVPPLEAVGGKNSKLTVREKMEKHRSNEACATCHRMIDPIGFGLENFDWMGRWRDTDMGKPVDASGVMPSGEKFTGPVELRQLMLKRKDEFLRTITGKVLGYALGRSLQDGDQCTVQKIMQTLAREHYGARTLIREVVLSVPFRNSQMLHAAPPANPVTTVRRPRREP